LLKAWDENKIEFVEQFKVMFLNRANKVLGIYDVSTGGISGTVADPRVVFVAALKANCCGIIISHNHPSGNLTPSRQDEVLTQKIKQAGQLLDIKLLDHVIVCNEGFYSFAEEGLL
jgi:DNA repair protein RadC